MGKWSLKAFLFRHRFDIVSITLCTWIKTQHRVAEQRGAAKDWWMLPGWSQIATLKLGNGDSWYHMCAFTISGAGKSIEIRLRMCGPPLFQIYMLVAWINAVVIFCLLQGSAFAVDFAILRSHFWYRLTVPKMGPWKCFSFVLLLSCACGPKNGTARRSLLEPCLGSFSEVFYVRVAEAQSFGFNETLWLIATEAGFRTQNWVRRSKLF